MKAGVVYSINSVRLQQLMRKAALLQLLHALLQLIHKQRAVAAAYAQNRSVAAVACSVAAYAQSRRCFSEVYIIIYVYMYIYIYISNELKKKSGR